jgi:molybdopterin-guanine dinucleotide biosynthesis protein A
MSTWSAVILAGGRGRRLGGRTKPLLEFDGQSILARQRAMLATLGVVPRLVAPDPAPFAGLGLEVVADDGRAGALGALCLALERAPTEVVVVLAGDMPFVTAGFIQALLTTLAGHDAAVPRTAGTRSPPRTGDRWRHGSAPAWTRGNAGSSPPSPRSLPRRSTTTRWPRSIPTGRCCAT